MKKLTRKITIDFRDIAAQSGCTRGTLCETAFGWGVQNGNGGVDFALIEPPKLMEGETELKIKKNHWRFYRG